MSHVSTVPAVPEVRGSHAGVEADVQRWGVRIFELMEAAEESAWFSQKRFYAALMHWAMEDERFKTQLFRFVDVLPSLTSSREIVRHLNEYLGEDQVRLSSALRLGLKASYVAPRLIGAGVKKQVARLARQFMLGDDEKEIAETLRQRASQNIGFTLDVLGETVVSETEADAYASRYLSLMESLARAMAHWPAPGKPGPKADGNAGDTHGEQSPPRSPASNDLSPRGVVPRLNLSIKVSALCSQIQAADPELALERITARLQPIVRRAKQLGALINFDMEQFQLKDLTLRLFKFLFSEPEFATEPACGVVIQAYLRDSERDLRNLLTWAQAQNRRVTIRLVKGAYWDYETIIAEQKRWPVPVFTQKAATDANFEKLSLLLLEHEESVEAAFGTHNVRSIAHALAQAERLGLDPRSYEFQMLYGMADSTKAALVNLGYRVREYCPVGELLPGMAYLVRRLLENTSNEGFLAQNLARSRPREELLRSPSEELSAEALPPSEQAAGNRFNPTVFSAESTCQEKLRFQNDPPTDFTIPAERERFKAALKAVRGRLGQRYSLILNNKPVQTCEWLPSLNPANQDEIIGFAAQATIADADAALAAAREAGFRWARTSIEERSELLERVADLLRRDRAQLAAWEVLEAGKTWTEADADVAEATDFCSFYAAAMREIGQPHQTQHVSGESNVQHWWPRGTGLVIAPWNFPLAILTGMTAAAVVAGNSVLMKPSDQTPIIAARLMELLIEAGLPAGVVNLVTGPGSSVGAHLVAHPHIDFIAFTGSKQVGLKIWETAGRTLPGQTGLKKVICEMGGKNPVIIDSDADLDEAVTGTIASAFGYQGQKCSALSRLIVLAENYDRFVPRLIAATGSLPVGPAEFPGTVLGPVISREAQQRILQLIEAGKSEATLVWQGQVPNDSKACYVPPSIFTGVPPNSRLFLQEIFGPVLAITKAKDFAEAITLANTSEYALTGGLYSRSPVHIERAKAELICGNLYINRPITGALVERQPFGGFKMSGGGTKAGGREYLHNFLVPRVITENCLRRGFAPPDEGL